VFVAAVAAAVAAAAVLMMRRIHCTKERYLMSARFIVLSSFNAVALSIISVAGFCFLVSVSESNKAVL
jgi:hypothetical protein